MLTFDQQDLLRQKYAIAQQEANAKTQDVANSGLVQRANAGFLGAQTKAYPDITAAQIAADNARTANLTTATGLLAPQSAADILLSNARARNLDVESEYLPKRYTSEIGLNTARVGSENAQAGFVRTQAKRLDQDNAGSDLASRLPLTTPRPKVIQGFGLPSYLGGVNF